MGPGDAARRVQALVLGCRRLVRNTADEFNISSLVAFMLVSSNDGAALKESLTRSGACAS
jgi:hypothetical protein